MHFVQNLKRYLLMKNNALITGIVEEKFQKYEDGNFLWPTRYLLILMNG
jgi:hypothetical protein